ncbi:MAG: hypothetical protein ACI83D_000551 [Planctomycetota bacterium]
MNNMMENVAKNNRDQEGASLGDIETKLVTENWYYQRFQLFEDHLRDAPGDQLDAVKGYINLLKEEYEIVELLSRGEDFLTMEEYYSTRNRIPIEGKEENSYQSLREFQLLSEDANLSNVQKEINSLYQRNSFIKEFEDSMWKNKIQSFLYDPMVVESIAN